MLSEAKSGCISGSTKRIREIKIKGYYYIFKYNHDAILCSRLNAFCAVVF